MNPKEKAKELIQKHLNLINRKLTKVSKSESIILAQESALISIDEVIESLYGDNPNTKFCNYWLDVRYEINTFILDE